MYEGLELSLVLKKVSQYASFEESMKMVEEETPSFHPLIIKRNLKMTKEAMLVIEKEHKPQFHGIKDICPLLEKAKKGIRLTAFELHEILVFHHHTERLKKHFDKVEELDVLKEYTGSLMVDAPVFQMIDRLVESGGRIKENASEKLVKLTGEENEVEKELSKRAKAFLSEHGASLQEEAVYQRNERVSFLLKNSDKYKYDGYLHGSSASGQATYVEPKEFIELNNRRSEISFEKEKEIEKILDGATALIAKVADRYARNFETFVILDGIFAKASYGYENDGHLGEITNDCHLFLKDAAHPLIDAKVVVSNNYELSDDYQGILISGTNTGGKTVSLKVIGLSVLLTYLGIPLLVSEAKIPLFDGVFVDIDDSQSIVHSLSTFSSHLSKVNEILENITANSFVLIDELASGTDPKQGQALSIAVVSKILEVGSRFVLTTHFDELKSFALAHPKILVSSVGFDQEKLQPTYHYIENTLGSSNALEIASRYLKDDSIIEAANDYLQKSASKEELLLKELEEKIEENERQSRELENEKEELILKKKELEKRLQQFENQKKELFESYQEELEEYIESRKEELEEIVKKMKDQGLKYHDALKEMQKVDALKKVGQTSEFNEVPKEETLAVGDRVRIKDNEQIGEIVELNKDVAVVNLRGLRIKVKCKDLKRMPKQVEKTVKKQSSHKPRVSKELVLVGMYVEEAMLLLEKYLDDAFASKMSSVRIVHGIGTGALRQAVQSYLKKCSFVKNYHFGDYYDGGSAVTIVEF